jgi:hypothetical protein
MDAVNIIYIDIYKIECILCKNIWKYYLNCGRIVLIDNRIF